MPLAEPQGAPRSGRPTLHQQTGRSLPAHLHNTRRERTITSTTPETSADECGPRERQRIDNWQPSSRGRASLKELSSQTSLDSGSLPRPCIVVWAPSALDEAAVVQNPLPRRVSLHCCLQRRHRVRKRFVRGAVREVDRYGGGSVLVWGGMHLNGRIPP